MSKTMAKRLAPKEDADFEVKLGSLMRIYETHSDESLSMRVEELKLRIYAINEVLFIRHRNEESKKKG